MHYRHRYAGGDDDAGVSPEVYGGAGVHVTELVAQLRRLCEVDEHCMGAPRETAFAHQPDPALADAQRCIDEFSSARIAEQTLEVYRKVAR